MRNTKIFFGFFCLTFAIGYSFVLILNFCNFDTETISTELKTKIQSEVENTDLPSEIQFQSKVFDVEGFWDENENQHNKHFIEIGEVSNGEDFKIKSGETWLGLFGETKTTYLQATKIRVKKLKDPNLSWKVFLTRTKEKPLFLVKNLKKVKAGKVKTVFRGHTWEEFDRENKNLTSLKKGFFREFTLGDDKVTLRVEEGLNEKQEPILVLLLENGEISEIIRYIYYSEEGDYVGNLYWVGDLDSDGKIDLYMDFGNYEKGSYSSGLFISSEAEKGKLVKLFEYYALAGC